jgi:hypothetical protein
MVAPAGGVRRGSSGNAAQRPPTRAPSMLGFDGRAEVAHAHPERIGELADRRPRRRCLPALDPRVGVERDTCRLGRRFLR